MLGADVGAFSRDDFAVQAWVNRILDDRPADSSLDAHISAVSMKLQILSADMNDELERSMTDLVSALPRASAEAERIEALAEALTGDLQRVEGRLSKLENATDSQVLVLERLDLLKRNMETCGETLLEAANWSQLVREIHASFAAQTLGKVATQLEAMHRSERVLRNVPGSQERTRTLRLLSDQLEKVLRPQLLAALSKQAATEAMASQSSKTKTRVSADLLPLVEMYRKLGKVSVLRSEYSAARPGPLHRQWFAFATPKDDFARWLPDFYQRVLVALFDELRKCKEVFGAFQAPMVAAEVVVGVFEPITASFAQRMLMAHTPSADTATVAAADDKDEAVANTATTTTAAAAAATGSSSSDGGGSGGVGFDVGRCELLYLTTLSFAAKALDAVAASAENQAAAAAAPQGAGGEEDGWGSSSRGGGRQQGRRPSVRKGVSFSSSADDTPGSQTTRTTKSTTLGDEEGEGEEEEGGLGQWKGRSGSARRSPQLPASLARVLLSCCGPFVEFQRRFGDLEAEHAWAACEGLIRGSALAPASAHTSSTGVAAPKLSAPSSLLGAEAEDVAEKAAAASAAGGDGAVMAAASAQSLPPPPPTTTTVAAAAVSPSALFAQKVESVGSVGPLVLGLAGQAVRRCLTFTGGHQAAALVHTLTKLLARFSLFLGRQVVGLQLRQLAGVALAGEGDNKGSKRRDRAKNNKSAAAGLAEAGAAAAAAAAGGDGSGVGVGGDASAVATATAADNHNAPLTAAAADGGAGGLPAAVVAFEWSYLQASLRLLQVAGQWCRGVREIEQSTALQLKPLFPLLFPPPPPQQQLSSSSSSSQFGKEEKERGGGSPPAEQQKEDLSVALLACLAAGPLSGSSSSSSSSSRAMASGGGALPAFQHAALALASHRHDAALRRPNQDDDDLDDLDGDDVGGAFAAAASHAQGNNAVALALDNNTAHNTATTVSSSSSSSSSSSRLLLSPAVDEEAVALQRLSVALGRVALASAQAAPPPAPPPASASSSTPPALPSFSQDLKGLLLGLQHVEETTGSAGCGGSGNGLLPGATKEAQGLALATRQLVLDLSLKVPREALKKLSEHEMWCGKELPTYSMQPSPHMTAVGEHLLGLYQELELFANASQARQDAEVLLFGAFAAGPAVASSAPSSSSLPSSSALVGACDADWRRLSLVLPLTEQETAVGLPFLAKGKKPKGTATLEGEHHEEDEDDDVGGGRGGGKAADGSNQLRDDDEEEDAEGKAAASFCSVWLLAAQEAVFATLLYQVLSVPKVDACGLAQLSTDLEYVLNVTAALGLPRHFLVAHLCALAKLDRDAYAAALSRPKPVSTAAGGADAAAASLVRKLERQFATLRGVMLVFGDDEGE